MSYQKSLLVSNILDPLTHEDQELQKVYQKIAQENKYNGLETRLIKSEETRLLFNKLFKELNWNVVLWLTGDMGRMSLNLSSLDDNLREKSLEKTYKLIDLASEHHCQKVGIGSGKIENTHRHEEHLVLFVESLERIMNYIDYKEYDLDIIVEPLDQFAHKKNVVGTLETCKKLLKQLEDNNWLENQRFTLCWDSAHVALNENDFRESLKYLAPYISRIHFSDAMTDKNNPEYGDNHRPFDDLGLMNVSTAKEIIEIFNSYKNQSKKIFVACEVRTKNKEKSWSNEQIYYDFLENVLEGY